MSDLEYKRVVIDASGARISVVNVREGMTVLDEEDAVDRNGRPLRPVFPEKAGEPTRVPYLEWLKSDLEDEVARRNESRDDSQVIVVDAPGNKPELAAALDADDAAHA
jgi:hypothetical protein